MKSKKLFIAWGMLAAALIFGLVLAGCSKKDSGGGSGGGSSSGRSSGGGKANPATDFSYDLSEDGQGIVIKGYTGKGGKVVVPEKIEDIPVVEIGEDAFNGKTQTISIDWNAGSATGGSETNDKAGITSIILPNTIKKIGGSAFANTAITKFDMPDSVTEIKNLFSGCNALAEIHLSDSLELIGGTSGVGLFGLSNKSLKKVNLPKSLKRISSAFVGCTELNELVIPDTLTSIAFGELDWHGDFQPGKEVNGSFRGCGKLPIKTRQRLQELGYKGDF